MPFAGSQPYARWLTGAHSKPYLKHVYGCGCKTAAASFLRPSVPPASPQHAEAERGSARAAFAAAVPRLCSCAVCSNRLAPFIAAVSANTHDDDDENGERAGEVKPPVDDDGGEGG